MADCDKCCDKRDQVLLENILRNQTLYGHRQGFPEEVTFALEAEGGVEFTQ